MRHFSPILILLAGCDLFGTVRPGGKPVSEAYGGSHELRVLDVESPLRAEKKVPILSTPEVLAVYVPTHAEGDRLIGEHWVYVRLRESEWFIERLHAPDPPATGDAPPETMRTLKELDWSRVVVPYKN